MRRSSVVGAVVVRVVALARVRRRSGRSRRRRGRRVGSSRVGSLVRVSRGRGVVIVVVFLGPEQGLVVLLVLLDLGRVSSVVAVLVVVAVLATLFVVVVVVLLVLLVLTGAAVVLAAVVRGSGADEALDEPARSARSQARLTAKKVSR